MTDSSTSTRRSVVARFIQTESASGIVLLVAAVAALAWVNSPWSASYDDAWHTAVNLRVGTWVFAEDLRHVVNDGFMAIFFFVVGHEVKREFVNGELADLRVAALPVFAAIGGMVIPALLFTAVVAGSPGAHGWGVPIATDIAFALGVLALLGSRVPAGVKLFMLTFAIVDDIGAIVVIALFYGGDLKFVPLALAGVGVAATFVLRRAHVDWLPLYVLLAVFTWVATHESGVHATIAGVALALATPAERRDSTLHPSASFIVLPLFALANAGIAITRGMFDGPGARRLAVGVVVGLVVGKFAGILCGAWIGVRVRAAVLPDGVRWVHVAGAAALGGIGFTVSLFVATLAFPTAALADAARASVLLASVVAAFVGSGILVAAARRTKLLAPQTRSL